MQKTEAESSVSVVNDTVISSTQFEEREIQGKAVVWKVFDKGQKIAIVNYVHETDKALCVKLPSGKSKWVPKKHLHETNEVSQANRQGWLVTNVWLASELRKEGIGI